MNTGWERTTTPGERWTDTAFPAGRTVLDPTRVARALAGRMPVGAPTGRARLLDVYYYPGRSLQAVHRLSDGTTVTIEGVPDGREPAPGEVAVPELDAVARTFPHDPGLPSLPAVLAQAGGAPDLLTYLPGRRCVLGTADRVAKLSTAAAVGRAHRRQLALWRAPARRFRMAEPLALDAGLAVRWERRLSGDRVEVGLGGPTPTVLADHVARELAALHALSPAGLDLSRTGRGDLLTRLERKTLRTLRRVVPSAVTDQAAGAVALLREAAPPVPGPASLVHGDCHLANLLVDDEGVMLLDLDEMAVGDPESDLAQVATRALLIALHRGTGVDAAAALAVRLPHAYAAARGRVVDPSVYAWYVAAYLLSSQVKTSVRHLAPDLDRLVLRLVVLARDVLRHGVVDEDVLAPAAAA